MIRVKINRSIDFIVGPEYVIQDVPIMNNKIASANNIHIDK